MNYFTLVPPPVGTSSLDPVFGTAIRRISDARHQPNSADGGNLAFVVNEYSTMSPFSQDNSWILLVHQSYFALYDREGRYQQGPALRHLGLRGAAVVAPRSEPVCTTSPETASRATTSSPAPARSCAPSAEYETVGGQGESDLCFDGDHLVLVGDRHDIFVYELSTNGKGPVLDAAGHGFDNVAIAPGDQVIVTWHQAGAGPRAESSSTTAR